MQLIPANTSRESISAGTSGNSSIDASAVDTAAGMILVGGDGKNTLKGSTGTDVITGGDKIDTIIGKMERTQSTAAKELTQSPAALVRTISPSQTLTSRCRDRYQGWRTSRR